LGLIYLSCCAIILFCVLQYKRSEDGSEKKTQILNQIKETVRHRTQLDSSMELIGTLLFGPKKGSAILKSVREPGSPLVDDWICLKSMVAYKCLFKSFACCAFTVLLITNNVLNFENSRFDGLKHTVDH